MMRVQSPPGEWMVTMYEVTSKRIMQLGIAMMLVALLMLWSLFPTLRYLLQQAGPFLKHHIAAVSTERILKAPDTSSRTRAFLRQVRDVRAFAVNELGLSDSSNYTSYYRLERDFLAAVIQAAPEFSLEPYMFRYPLFGAMPYKGYYEVQAAKAEAQRLEQRGLDVYVRKVDAFSSLGFFSDPLFSFMEDYSPDRLAELIIHEQTHATLFIKDHSTFNEQLATFVARKGTERYIAETYGRDSGEYRSMERRRHDAELFRTDMAGLASKLQELYGSGVGEAQMRRGKRRILRAFQTSFSRNYDSRYQTDNYAGIAEMRLNNAFLSLFRLYEPQSELFEMLYTRAGTIEAMMAHLQEAPGVRRDPWGVKLPED
jgi:predicted aminopeptidase